MLTDRVPTIVDLRNSLQNETIQLKCTVILFSHLYMALTVYVSFVMVVYALSNAGTL